MNTKVKSFDLKAIESDNSSEVKTRTIVAIVTSGKEDRDGDIVDVKSLRFPLKDGGYVLGKDLDGSQELDLPFLLNHSFDVEDMLGSWHSGRYLPDTDEIELEAGVSTRYKAQDIMKLFDEGFVGNNFSITMNDYVYDEPYIYDAEVLECSFVYKGANKEARLLLVKSLKAKKTSSEVDMSDKERIAKLEAELQALKDKSAETVENEVEQAENETEKIVDDTQNEENTNVAQSETTDNTDTEDVEETKTEVVDETQETEATEEETETVAVEVVDDNNNNNERADDMENVAVKQVKDAVEAPEVATKSYTDAQIRKNFVAQFKAKFIDGDSKKFADVRAKAVEMAGLSKSILGSDGDSIFMSSVVARDITKCYNAVAGYSLGVSKIDIAGNTLIDMPVITEGTMFERVGRGQSKPVGTPALDTVRIEPREWAKIFAWFDYVQKQTTMSIYNMIVEFVAEAYAKTEDYIVLKYAGGQVTGEPDADKASGLVPLLTTANRKVTTTDATTASIIAGLTTAIGSIEGEGEIEIGTNRATWSKVVMALMANGTFLGNADGTISLGGAGTLKPVFSSVLADNELVVGIRRNYQYVTNGGLATLFSQHATINDEPESEINLFQQDASGLRAEFWAAGAPKCLSSFYLVEIAE